MSRSNVLCIVRTIGSHGCDIITAGVDLRRDSVLLFRLDAGRGRHELSRAYSCRVKGRRATDVTPAASFLRVQEGFQLSLTSDIDVMLPSQPSCLGSLRNEEVRRKYRDTMIIGIICGSRANEKVWRYSLQRKAFGLTIKDNTSRGDRIFDFFSARTPDVSRDEAAEF